MITIFLLLYVASLSDAHTAAWAPGMYCLGTAQNWNVPVHPLYKLPKKDWWFQHDRGCDTQPPPPGEFLELPAGGTFTVELAHNKLQTTRGTCPAGLRCMSDWPDGRDHPEDWKYPDGDHFEWPVGMGRHGESVGFDGKEHQMGRMGMGMGMGMGVGMGMGMGMGRGKGMRMRKGMGMGMGRRRAGGRHSGTFDCLSDFQLHTKNESMAAGTAWAISYQSDLSAVTMENLVVFTTLANTPWKRLATYEVPAALPVCPPRGCTCAWLWVPSGCGDPNMYMQGFKCKVTDSVSDIPVAKAQPPVPCKDDQSKCVKGAKQIIAWHQLSGNNVDEYYEYPGYNTGMGWTNGAQHDIFQENRK